MLLHYTTDWQYAITALWRIRRCINETVSSKKQFASAVAHVVCSRTNHHSTKLRATLVSITTIIAGGLRLVMAGIFDKSSAAYAVGRIRGDHVCDYRLSSAPARYTTSISKALKLISASWRA